MSPAASYPPTAGQSSSSREKYRMQTVTLDPYDHKFHWDPYPYLPRRA